MMVLGDWVGHRGTADTVQALGDGSPAPSAILMDPSARSFPRRLGIGAVFSVLAFGTLFAVAAAFDTARAQNNVDDFSTWSPGNQTRPAPDLSTRPVDRPSTTRRADGRPRKRANHPSTIADPNVSRERPGVYRSINRAIAHTAPGGLVTVEPGYYTESLEIDWPVRISGRVRVGHNIPGRIDDEREAFGKVRISPPVGKPCAQIKPFRNETVDIRDVWFQLVPGSASQPCIDHQRGSLVLVDSLVETHRGAPAVLLSGQQAALENNTIRGGLIGVYISASTEFSDSPPGVYTLEDNRISENGVGVNADSYGARVFLRENKIEKNERVGVVLSKGDILATNNEIKSNAQDGVVILYAERVRLISNEVQGNKRFGLYMPITNSAELEDNLIACNIEGGIAPGGDDDDASEAYPGNTIEQNPPERRRFRRFRRRTNPCAKFLPRE